jgi:hypothetical protein
MDDENIRHHIEEASHGGAGDARRMTESIVSFCWPGGPADRSDPGALAWVRRWRPARAAAALPVCSCAHGNCAVCN